MKVEVKDISKSFGERELFSNVSYTFEPGTVSVIMGKSGAGKTTLLNIIGLIESVNTGKVFYNDIELKRKSEIRNKLKHEISFIFQNFGLLENENVQYNMTMSHAMKKLKKDKQMIEVKKALKKVKLEDFEDKMTHYLSGGEQQRVAIAKSILKDASVILADEPTASVDKENEAIILELLSDFAKRGKTVIIVSHSEVVASHADKIIIID